MKLSVDRVNAGKKYFQDTMKGFGSSPYESYGNFVHVRFGKYADEIHKILEGKVYYRKDFTNPCLGGYSRFSTTTKERFKPIIKCIIDVVIEYKKKSLLIMIAHKVAVIGCGRIAGHNYRAVIGSEG